MKCSFVAVYVLVSVRVDAVVAVAATCAVVVVIPVGVIDASTV